MSHQAFLYHIVFRTKGSMCSIDEQHERELYAYILGICRNKDCKLYRIGGMSDHIHMLISIPPKYSVSEFMKVLKVETNKWIHQSKLFPIFCGWARGYAAFTYSIKEKQSVYNYIANQKQHHKYNSFVSEFFSLLKEHGLNTDDDDFFDDE